MSPASSAASSSLRIVTPGGHKAELERTNRPPPALPSRHSIHIPLFVCFLSVHHPPARQFRIPDNARIACHAAGPAGRVPRQHQAAPLPVDRDVVCHCRTLFFIRANLSRPTRYRETPCRAPSSIRDDLAPTCASLRQTGIVRLRARLRAPQRVDGMVGFQGRIPRTNSATSSNLRIVTPGGQESELARTNGPPAASAMTDLTYGIRSASASCRNRVGSIPPIIPTVEPRACRAPRMLIFPVGGAEMLSTAWTPCAFILPTSAARWPQACCV